MSLEPVPELRQRVQLGRRHGGNPPAGVLARWTFILENRRKGFRLREIATALGISVSMTHKLERQALVFEARQPGKTE